MQITPLGDSALILEVGEHIDEPTHRRVQEALAVLEAGKLPAVSELVPAYTTVTLFYDPLLAIEAGAPGEDVPGWLAKQVQARLAAGKAQARATGRKLEIPVVYGGEYGPDLAEVAQKLRLSPEEVVRRHSGTEYLVYMLGFSPGFPYLGKLPPELALPRRSSPRTAVPPGSVGISNDQTCIYPQATPGGWNLIGRTPLTMFDPAKDPPTLLQAGDRVRFRGIEAGEFGRLEGKPWA
jgi:inhibitor of KinA